MQKGGALREALALLSLTLECTPADAKAAYKRKALECHPDRNTSADATREFQALGAAYARVRQFHDGGGQNGDGDDGTFPSRDAEIEEMLREMFGERLSKGAAAAIASTLGAGPSQPPPPPPHGRWNGPPTNPSLAEKIAATRAKVKAVDKAAREASRVEAEKKEADKKDAETRADAASGQVTGLPSPLHATPPPSPPAADGAPPEVRSRQGRASQVKSSPAKTSPDKSSQVKSSQDKTRQVKTRQDKPTQGKPSQDKASQVKPSQDSITCIVVCDGISLEVVVHSCKQPLSTALVLPYLSGAHMPTYARASCPTSQPSTNCGQRRYRSRRPT